MKIPKDIEEIHEKFIAAGKELFLVGGCVRDFKLNLEPKDFDMATNAFPEEIESILKGYTMDLTGKQFGVMRVRTDFDPTGYEIATYREDKSAGRKPIVKIGSTMKKDAFRRDFTINALYYNISTKEIIDLVGGKHDIENKIIRACGDPIQRINDDALRMLRAVRFKHTISGTIDKDLHNALMEHPILEGPDENGNIIPISQERIAEEFLKGLNKSYSSLMMDKYTRDLMQYKFLEQVFRGLIINDNFTFTNTKVIEIAIADLLRLNTDRKKLFETLVYQCKFSKELVEGVIFLLELEDIDENKVYKLKRKMNKTNLTNANLLEYGMVLIANKKIEKIPYINAFSKYKITTSGDELKAEGFVDVEIGIEIEKREKQKFLQIL